MTSARPCRTCARPIKWVGGFRQPVDAEGAYFIVEPDGIEQAVTERSEWVRGHFGKVTHGAVWRVAYRPHICAPADPAQEQMTYGQSEGSRQEVLRGLQEPRLRSGAALPEGSFPGPGSAVRQLGRHQADPGTLES